MTADSSRSDRAQRSRGRMARWRCWLFNRIARWEEAAFARSLGLPAERVILVDLSPDD